MKRIKPIPIIIGSTFVSLGVFLLVEGTMYFFARQTGLTVSTDPAVVKIGCFGLISFGLSMFCENLPEPIRKKLFYTLFFAGLVMYLFSAVIS